MFRQDLTKQNYTDRRTQSTKYKEFLTYKLNAIKSRLLEGRITIAAEDAAIIVKVNRNGVSKQHCPLLQG